MKNIKLLGLMASACAVLAATPASAEINYIHQGPYVSGAAGVSLHPDEELTPTANLPRHKYSFDPGFATSLAGGYAWGNNVRTELELGYRHASTDGITNPFSNTALGADATYGLGTVMLNAIYDLDINTRILPYVGVGVGYGHLFADEIAFGTSATTTSGADDSAGNLAYQALAGLAYKIDNHWYATLDYRFLATREIDLGTTKTEYSTHNIMVGVRYHFDAPPPPAPVPAPAPVQPQPVAQPAPPPVVNTYMVFFDFDKSIITPEAKNILASVANDFKNGRAVSVNVTGHADRSGTTNYNDGLSQRRAAAVKAELGRLGVPAGQIATRARGENSPLVPTADGVREAQNRRAEIVFGDQ